MTGRMMKRLALASASLAALAAPCSAFGMTGASAAQDQASEEERDALSDQEDVIVVQGTSLLNVTLTLSARRGTLVSTYTHVHVHVHVHVYYRTTAVF